MFNPEAIFQRVVPAAIETNSPTRLLSSMINMSVDIVSLRSKRTIIYFRIDNWKHDKGVKDNAILNTLNISTQGMATTCSNHTHTHTHTYTPGHALTPSGAL